MRFSRLLTYTCCAVFALFANAQPLLAVSIGLGDFSGSETVVSLANLPGADAPIVVVDDLTFTSSQDFRKQSGLTEISQDGSFTMDLAVPQQRVGLELKAFASVTGDAPVTWSVEAFDSAMSSLEIVQISQPVAGAEVFGGVARSEGIARILVTEVTPAPTGSNYATFINEVRFEAIPEPTSAVLLLVGLSVSLLRRVR